MYEHGNIEHEEAALDSVSSGRMGVLAHWRARFLESGRHKQVQQKKHEREVKYIKSHVLSWLGITIDYRDSKWLHCNLLSNWLEENCHRQLERIGEVASSWHLGVQMALRVHLVLLHPYLCPVSGQLTSFHFHPTWSSNSSATWVAVHGRPRQVVHQTFRNRI